MTRAEREERLKELNAKCQKCMEDAEKRFETINPQSCLNFCKVGQEIHKLDDPNWDNQDWNSAKLEQYYHN